MRQIAKALIVLTALIGSVPAPAQSPARAKSRVLCYTSYDSEYFYFAAVVQKPVLAGKNTAFFSNPLEDDSIAVFLQLENGAQETKRSAKSVEMVASVAGGGQLYRGANATPLQNFTDFLKNSEGRPQPFKYAVLHRGTLNAGPSNDSGYTVEMAIPWIELGGPPAVGQKLRFNVVAFSAAAPTTHLLSLSPAVKAEPDIQNPSLWDEIIFVDAPVKTVASAPQAKVSARLFSAKPLIDGSTEEAVWNTLTAFGFSESAEGGSEDLAPTVGIARTRPKVNLKKARPAITPIVSAAKPLTQHVTQAVPRLVFALYNYNYQNDPRKSAPLESVKNANGASLIATHPMEGAGPWMTYDRLDWHRQQMEDCRKAGIDVILPVYRASVFAKQRYSQRGLVTLTGALNQMSATGAEYPLVAMYLDTHSLSDSRGEKPDLKNPDAQAKLYAAIKDFYLAVPSRYRVSVPLDSKNGGGSANVVVLSSSDAFSDMDSSFMDYCRAQYKAEFGADLLFLGDSGFKGKANLDGFVNDTHGRGFQMDESGWIKPASVGVGYDESLQLPAPPEPMRSRKEGETYKSEWKQALAKRPNWVFIDGWNDFMEGAEIAPTMQNGIEYVDLTRVYTRMFAGAGAVMMRANYVGNTIPPVAAAGASYRVTVRVQNAGTGTWTPEGYSAIATWQRANGTPVGAGMTVPLPGPLLPGQSITLTFMTKAPAEPGAYKLAVDMAQTGKKGDVLALFSGVGSLKLEEPVEVATAESKSQTPYRVSIVSHDVPATVEAGGSYNVHVVLRNDGSSTWKKEGGRIVARLWRYTSPINGTGEPEASESIDMADAGADLPTDIAPGQDVTVTVPITFSQADGALLRSWSQADNWTYQLRWEYSADENGTAGAVTAPEPVAVVDADPGIRFTMDLTPRQLPGERRIPVKLGLRNLGPQTWVKDKVRVGYHWYYLDGTEAVWQDETTPLTQDVGPGGEVPEMLAWVTAPPNDGSYWLVWDLKFGDTWASTLPSARTNETRVHQVDIVHGRTQMVDLDKAYNLDAVAGSLTPRDGNFDGAGRTFPSELVPPFALSPTAPSTLWMPVEKVGIDSPRRISFKWGPKGDKENNFIQCLGQKVVVGDAKKSDAVKTVHILAASTKADTLGVFTLLFSDTSQQLTSFPLSKWDAPPTHGEEIAFFSRYSRTPAGESIDKPVALYRYTIRIPDAKKLIAILMPNSPEIKIAAITLEK